MADCFGDASLFEEFERDREQECTFISFSTGTDGEEDKSRIVFHLDDSSTSSDDSDDDQNSAKVNELQTSYTLKNLTKESESLNGPGDNSVEDEDKEEKEDVTMENGVKHETESRVILNEADRNLQSTNFKLKYERNKFLRFAKIIDSTRYIQDEESVPVQIIFQNNPFSRKYRTQIEGFIKYLMEQEARDSGKTLQKLDLKAMQPTCVDLNNRIPVEKRTDRMWQSHAIIGSAHCYRDFLMDSMGWPLVEYNPSLTDSWVVPMYEQVFKMAIPLDEESLEKIKREEAKERPKACCWNCGREHMLADCKEPRDQSKINESRMKHMADQAARSSGKPSSKRYHLEADVDPRFEKFKPGFLSKELRQALGLSEEKLPIYIYRMRAMGYPPGWLEEAQNRNSGLVMFDKDGREVNITGDCMEDGEVEDENDGTTNLDVDKIIEYPGFTVAVPPGIVDEHEYFELPALQPHQLKSALVDIVITKERKKRKHEEDGDSSRKKIKLVNNEAEMELSSDEGELENGSFIPPLPVETPPSKPPLPEDTPPATPDSQRKIKYPKMVGSRQISLQSENRKSPSLEELEMQFELLQKKLEQDDSDIVILDSFEDNSSPDSGSAVVILDEISEAETKAPVAVKQEDDIQSDEVIEIADDSLELNDNQKITPSVPRQMSSQGSVASINMFGEMGTGSPVISSAESSFVVPESADSSQSSFSRSLSMSKEYGTPILHRANSYSSLPSNENFGAGIEEHIPYENLPDSTGTFNRMRGLIKRIRDKVGFRKNKKKS
ncbi:hypothetical protein CHS0354_019825 [Potamilus streckersoni]|uniref:PSP proline-rich domain-containing protein n=1 Tax=Potamilus streckersoni TaxID=2493646 RepID=A0AAE0TEZ4_9BIVA|nr:hypothetical protein CHS0354_019825 [Potamilus streckersoni]